jgi:O-antigen ligase
VIWGKGLASFKEHPMGIGPASFAGQVDTGLGEDGMIELHSDFVSTLVERGVIGFLGYILIILWIAREVFRMLNLASMSPARRDGVWAAGLAGAVAAYFFYSITHEAMHHDSFWLLLALVFSQVRIMRSKFDAWASPREEIPPLSLDPARRNVDRRHLKARSPA